MKGLAALAILLLTTLCVFSQKDASVREYRRTFTTYPYSDADPLPQASPVYPYFRWDGFTDKPTEKQWKVVELRNDYITVLILPEVGGKIWGAFVNETGRPFIYFNGAVKFRDVAMRGPWTSGGLEANYGIIGHAPSCAAPVDYVTQRGADGGVSCVIGVLDLLTRSEWRIEINLPKDKAYFTTRSFWYNLTPLSQPYYHWMNLGMPSKGGLEFLFPGTHYIGHEGEHAEWPVNKSNGKRINFYEENNFGGYKSYHVVGKLTNYFGAYYHDSDKGMVRVGGYDDKAGKKIWIWGLSRQGMIWEKMLTDTSGQYVELQSGRLFNQNSPGSSRTPFKHIGFTPYGSDMWTEYWYPIEGTKGLAAANEHGGMNVRVADGWLKIYLSAVQRLDDTVVARSGGKDLYRKHVAIEPLGVWRDSVRWSGEEGVVELVRCRLRYELDTVSEVLHRPLDAPATFDWSSAYGEYLQGRELVDQKLYAQAAQSLARSLEKDANYLPSLAEMAALSYRNMRYSEALGFARRALQVDAVSGAANYYYAVINEQLGHMADAKDGYSLAALTAEYRSAGYVGLARIAGLEGDDVRSIDYAEKALGFDMRNMEALRFEAVAHRRMGNRDAAMKVLERILGYDALNHFARWEQFLWSRKQADKDAFVAGIRSELPHESFTELAIWYHHAGYADVAAEIFGLDRSGSPETACWLGFLSGSKVNLAGVPMTRAFPFRSETGAVLERLVRRQDDWQLKYQLALIYRDRGRIEECRTMLRACGSAPDYAPFYAVRAGIFKEDSAAYVADLQTALRLDPSQWRFHKLLAEHYIDARRLPEALVMAGNFYTSHPGNYIMGMLYAKTLLLSGKYRNVDALLSRLNIIPFEGATEGRTLYREAKLMQGLEAMDKGDRKGAVAFIKAAREWPEHLGVGKPYDEEIDGRLEDWMEYVAGGGVSEPLLRRVLAFRPRVDNTIRNFIPSNALVTAWARERARAVGMATPDGAVPDQADEHEQPALLDNGKDPNGRILKALMRSSAQRRIIKLSPWYLIAHRGGVVDSINVENSLPALEGAIAKGYQAVEMDMRLTKDGVLIIQHDKHFRRYYGVDSNVSDMSWASISRLVSDKGSKVVTLEEELRHCKGRLQVMLDNKIEGNDTTVWTRVISLLRKYSLLDSAIMIGTDSSTDWFRGKVRLSCSRQQLEENVRRPGYKASDYFLFGGVKSMTAEDVKWAAGHGIMVVGAVNMFAYRDGGVTAAYKDIETLKGWGVTRFQIDSELGAAFTASEW